MMPCIGNTPAKVWLPRCQSAFTHGRPCKALTPPRSAAAITAARLRGDEVVLPRSADESTPPGAAAAGTITEPTIPAPTPIGCGLGLGGAPGTGPGLTLPPATFGMRLRNAACCILSCRPAGTRTGGDVCVEDPLVRLGVVCGLLSTFGLLLALLSAETDVRDLLSSLAGESFQSDHHSFYRTSSPGGVLRLVVII